MLNRILRCESADVKIKGKSRKQFLFLVLSLTAIFGLFTGCATTEVKEDSAAIERNLGRVVTRVIAKYHYYRSIASADLSQQLFDKFIDSLDPEKIYLSRDVVRGLNLKYSNLHADLREGRLDNVIELYQAVHAKVDERLTYARDLLGQDYEFSNEDRFNLDRNSVSWASDDTELDLYWRKKVKHDELSMRFAGLDFATIQERLLTRYGRRLQEMSLVTSRDILDQLLVSYTRLFPRTTNYVSPALQERRRVTLMRSISGIGVAIGKEGHNIVIKAVLPDSQSKHAGLRPGDVISGVGDFYSEEFRDLYDLTLEETIDLLRGPAMSTVRLQVRRKMPYGFSEPVEIELSRAKPQRNKGRVSMTIVPVRNSSGAVRNIGVIRVPRFYRDVEAEQRGDKDFISTAGDVKEKIDAYRDELAGFIVDLRGNRGGGFGEAIDLASLFVTGPIVQTKDAFGKTDIDQSRDAGLFYQGPMAVLIDNRTGGSSEIFAAAMQDYGRALVVGNRSFGLNTISTSVDLQRLVNDGSGGYGSLTLAMAKFFRVDGSELSALGVVPDIKTGEFAGEIETNTPVGGLVSKPEKLERLVSDRLNERLIAGIRTRYREESSIHRQIARLDRFYDELKAMKRPHVSLNRSSRSTELLEERLRKRELLEAYADLYGGDLSQVKNANSVETKLNRIYELKSQADLEAAIEVFGYYVESTVVYASGKPQLVNGG